MNKIRSFCGKINIKPLSTADFGKVMKQVFPDIRPRRLGTRGHSRYCYAAMRKATKLNSPHLPDLTITRNDSATRGKLSGDGDVSWNVIKNWSESLLGTQFESFDDLATHISQNLNLMSTPSTSKQMLHKKLMQRESKDKKRSSSNNNHNNNIVSILNIALCEDFKYFEYFFILESINSKTS